MFLTRSLIFILLLTPSAWASEIVRTISIKINKSDVDYFKTVKNCEATFFNNKNAKIVSLKLDENRLVGESDPMENCDFAILMVNGYYSARLVKESIGWIVPDLTRVEFDFSKIKFTKEELLIGKYIGIRSKQDEGNFTFCWGSKTGITKYDFLIQSGTKIGFFVFDSEQQLPPMDFKQLDIPISDKPIFYIISKNPKEGYLVSTQSESL